VTFIPQEIQIGGDWAIDRFTWSTDTTPVGGGTSSNDKGKCIWIWRRQRDGSWKVARAIWNSDNPVPGTVWSGTPRAAS
jgi:ketosteroid isomerase-like protein